MDLLIYTGADDLSEAAVTSPTDLTALDTTTAFPQLVLGRTEPVTAKFLSVASTYEAWTADPTYTVTVALGYRTSDGTRNFTSAPLSTAIVNGKSGNLDLNTTQLQDAVGEALARRYKAEGGIFVLEVIVTDNFGARRTRAQLNVRVNGLVKLASAPNPDAGDTFLTTAEVLALISRGASGYSTQTNASGNTTVAPAKAAHTEILTFSGSGSTTRVVILAVAATQAAGDRATIRYNLPATAAITVETRNATAGGTLLTSLTTEGSGDDMAVEYYFDGTAWQTLRTQYPA